LASVGTLGIGVIVSATTDLHSRIASAARRRFGASRLAELAPLAGGHSGLTWVAALSVADGSERLIVVKSAPEGREPVGRHDVLRQARVIQALHDWGGLEVPEVYFSDAGAPPFFAMEHIDGRGDEPLLSEGGLPEPPDVIAGLWEQAVVNLAELSRADPDELGLGAGEPRRSPADELARWRATARSAGQDLEAKAAPLAHALEARAPRAARLGLLHGDFRIGNMLRHDGVIRALIDWEIWSLGDPRADLGWLVLFTDPSAFGGLAQPVGGTPEGAAVVARYEELTGRAVDDLDWFRALACFKLAAIQGHNLRRHREGRRHDPYLERFRHSIDRLLEVGLMGLS
jgi:aminoglycoside phosphotransferase (APT) family kinase protein